jgi:hypothetical protein
LFLTLFFMIALLWIPYSGNKRIKKEFEEMNINRGKVLDELSHFLEDIRTTTRPRASFNIIFLTRRLVTAILLVMLDPMPFFAIVGLIWMSLIKLMYLIVSRPKLDRNVNILDLFNEGSIYLFTIFLGNLLNIAFPD